MTLARIKEVGNDKSSVELISLTRLCYFLGRENSRYWLWKWNGYPTRSIKSRGDRTSNRSRHISCSLMQQISTVIYTDFSSQDTISYARRNAHSQNLRPPQVAFVYASLTEPLPISSCSIDCVLLNCANLLSFFGNKNLLEQVYRVLKPGGRIVFDDVSSKSLSVLIFIYKPTEPCRSSQGKDLRVTLEMIRLRMLKLDSRVGHCFHSATAYISPQYFHQM